LERRAAVEAADSGWKSPSRHHVHALLFWNFYKF